MGEYTRTLKLDKEEGIISSIHHNVHFLWNSDQLHLINHIIEMYIATPEIISYPE